MTKTKSFHMYTVEVQSGNRSDKSKQANVRIKIMQRKGGFSVITEITRCHTFTKEINHARARSQYFNENSYCKNYLRVFSAMTGKLA